MFLDSLGHNFKDFIILLFIIFTIVLSIYIFILNSNLEWWNNNDNCKINIDEKKEHQPNNVPVILASIFMASIGLVIIYSIGKVLFDHSRTSNN